MGIAWAVEWASVLGCFSQLCLAEGESSRLITRLPVLGMFAKERKCNARFKQ